MIQQSVSMEEIPGLDESVPQLTRHSSSGDVPDPMELQTTPTTSPHLRYIRIYMDSCTVHSYQLSFIWGYGYLELTQTTWSST